MSSVSTSNDGKEQINSYSMLEIKLCTDIKIGHGDPLFHRSICSRIQMANTITTMSMDSNSFVYMYSYSCYLFPLVMYYFSLLGLKVKKVCCSKLPKLNKKAHKGIKIFSFIRFIR